MHGLSNDFVVINTLTQTFNPTPELIQQLAHRQMGIGFDQMLLVGPAPSDQIDIDFSYRIFNADGSEVAQCGNGARCLARFIYEHQLSHKKHLRVQTLAGILELHIEAIDQIRVNMGIPNFVPANIPCLAKTILPRYQIDDIVFGAISLGNPHAVILVDNINQAPVEKIGRFLQAQAFFPESVNVGFMQINNPQHINLRVYERGAGETAACGSGACAAVVIGKTWGLLNAGVQVSLPGGQLRIDWSAPDQPVWMTGPAVQVFDGTYEIP